MAHYIEHMADVGQTPWHGLGSMLSPKQPIEVWQKEAGMNWRIEDTPGSFQSRYGRQPGINSYISGTKGSVPI